MKLIIGLGNPGANYKKTWHNLGFIALDRLAESLASGKFKKPWLKQAEIAVGTFRGEKIILAKPLSFMNNSGKPARDLANYYKIKTEDIIIIHDDLDLPLGKLRLIKNSSAGGHNGVKSLIENFGTKDFVRIKIGCGTPLKDKMPTADYVLANWGKDEEKAVTTQTEKAAEAALIIIADGLEKAMTAFN